MLGAEAIKSWYPAQNVQWQLKWDKLGDGCIMKANAHNQKNCRLLSFPAELRNVIWAFAIAPEGDPNTNLETSVLDRSNVAYPDGSILLASRGYSETLSIYTHSVTRF